MERDSLIKGSTADFMDSIGAASLCCMRYEERLNAFILAWSEPDGRGFTAYSESAALANQYTPSIGYMYSCKAFHNFCDAFGFDLAMYFCLTDDVIYLSTPGVSEDAHGLADMMATRPNMEYVGWDDYFAKLLTLEF